MFDKKAYRRQYYLKHRKENGEQARKWEVMHPEKTKEIKKRWKKLHPETKRKERGKYKANRRHHFGFTPLNKSFAGSHGHHLDQERVIYIPVSLHKSIYHSVTQNINMEQINELAYNFLREGNFHDEK